MPSNIIPSFPFTIRIGDINYGNHVGADALIHIMHQARLDYLDALGGFTERQVDGTVGLIMLSLEINFKNQLFYKDCICVSISPVEIKRTSFTLEYTITKEEVITHQGTTKMAFFDYTKQAISIAPVVFTQALEKQKALGGL